MHSRLKLLHSDDLSEELAVPAVVHALAVLHRIERRAFTCYAESESAQPDGHSPCVRMLVVSACRPSSCQERPWHCPVPA